MLGRLGKRVKRAGVEAARDKEFSGALGGGFEENRRLDFEKTFVFQRVTDGFGGEGAGLDEVQVARSAQVEEAVFEAQVFADLVSFVVLHWERQRLADVVDGDFVGYHFHLAGGELGIDGLGGTFHDLAGNLDHGFRLESVGLRVHFAAVGVKHHLGDALAIAQIDEADAPEIAHGVNPANQGYFFPGVGGRQAIAVVSAEHFFVCEV